MNAPNRCGWVTQDPLYQAYHDTEWGVPQHDDTRIFEAIVLDGFQAGLSWLTILKKRENFRAAFDGFDATKVAAYGEAEIERLVGNAGIIRNRQKIVAAIGNAQAFLRVQAEFNGFHHYVWGFVNGKPLQNGRKRDADVPATSEISDAMSKDMKKRCFKFAGSTICYAFMQALGLVNDHTVGCFRHDPVKQLGQ